jgi:Domain of unknown function (DUF4371)
MQVTETAFSILLSGIIENNESVESYLSHMSKSGTWGDGNILAAASLLYQRQVVIYSDDSEKSIFSLRAEGSDILNSGIIRLGYVGKVHYVSLIPVSSGSTVGVQETAVNNGINNSTCRPNKALKSLLSHQRLSSPAHNEQMITKKAPQLPTMIHQVEKPEPAKLKKAAGSTDIVNKRRSTYLWLIAFENGALCRHCSVFYANRTLPKGTNGVFINKPFTNWDKSTGSQEKHNKLLKHDSSQMHKIAICHGTQGDKMDRNKKSVYSMVHKQSAEDRSKNLERLMDFAEAAYYLFHSEISHTTHYTGLLNLISHLDHSREIANFMEKSPENASYVSHNTATELLEASAHCIRSEVLKKIRKSAVIAIMADESTDIRVRNEISVCCRFIVDGSSVEQFLCLGQLQSTTADEISEAILKCMADFEIPLENVYWLAFDGAANMSGKTNGVQAKLKKHMVNAKYIHCRSHLLSLAASNVALEFKPLKALFSMFNSTWKFFHNSPKRHNKLVEMQKILDDPSLELVRSGDTRWTSNYRSVKAIRTCLRAIVFSLQEIHSTAGDLSCEAGGLLLVLQNASSVVMIYAVEQVLQPLHSLTLILQSSKLSLADLPNRVIMFMTF